MCKKIYLIRDEYPKYIKNSYKSLAKKEKKKHQIKIQAEDVKDIFTKITYR